MIYRTILKCREVESVEAFVSWHYIYDFEEIDVSAGKGYKDFG